MSKSLSKSAVMVMLLSLGLLFTSVAPSALAQGRCRQRELVRYEQDRYNDYRYDYDRDYDYRYREDGKKQTLKRVGIGTAIGAAVGGVIGGRKGALIGAGIGAAGGYVYHRSKKDRYERYRY